MGEPESTVIYLMPVRNGLSRIGCALLFVVLASTALVAQNTPTLQPQPQSSQAKIATLEQQVQNYLREQKPQLAIPVLQEIVSLDAKNLNAQANLGVLLYFQRNYADAISHMRAALELKPDLWKVEALLGMAEKRAGNPRAAQEDLERAVSNVDDTKTRVEAGLELIELYSASVQLDKALSVAQKLQ